jgi:2-dehydro-3-deoxyphosphogluconate aldolase/(4S)-4-hydroxy-2-oxoglutarate aldolase
VLTAANVQAAADAGARFAVAPGLNPAVVARARQAGLPFVPGVCTPSEIEHAVTLDCKVLKFFPAQALGGLATIRAVAGPYQHLGLRLIPTGGVNLTNLESYLAADVVLAVGGTWLAKRDDLAEGRWALVRDRCRQAVEIVAKVRGLQSPAAKL